MRYYDVPVIAGSVEQQIEQIKNYLYLQHEQLNYNLGQQTAEKVFEQAQAALTKSADPIESEEVKSRYQAFRDLIIGTANEAFKAGDGYSEILRQIEGYRSEFGTFTEEITREIGTAPTGTTDVYSYIGSVLAAQQSYALRMENFIKTGYLDRTANPPVFGVEIGLRAQSYQEDGQTIQGTPEKIRITPGRISFITGSGNSETEAAYMSQGAVYFPNAQITGGSISIGNGAFSVSSAGVLSATGATIGGRISAGSGSTIGPWSIGQNAIYRGRETFDSNDSLYFGTEGLSLGSTFKVTNAGHLTCTSATIGGWTVNGNGLERALTAASDAVTALLNADGLSFGIYDGNQATTNYSGITTQGILRARGAIISGTIYAGGGDIGGWIIATDRLKKLNNQGHGIQLIPGNTPQIQVITDAVNLSGGINAVSAYAQKPTLVATDGTNSAYVTPVGIYCTNGGTDWAYFGNHGFYINGTKAGQINGALGVGGNLTVAGALSAGSLANSGTQYFKIGGYTVAWGKNDVRLSSGEATNVTISYPVTFGEDAFVVATLSTTNPHQFHVGISDRGRSSFKVTIKPDGGTYSGNMGVLWLAIGKD